MDATVELHVGVAVLNLVIGGIFTIGAYGSRHSGAWELREGGRTLLSAGAFFAAATALVAWAAGSISNTWVEIFGSIAFTLTSFSLVWFWLYYRCGKTAERREDEVRVLPDLWLTFGLLGICALAVALNGILVLLAFMLAATMLTAVAILTPMFTSEIVQEETLSGIMDAVFAWSTVAAIFLFLAGCSVLDKEINWWVVGITGSIGLWLSGIGIFSVVYYFERRKALRDAQV